MKAILLGDLHLGASNSEENLFNMQLSVIKKIIAYCIKHKIKKIIQFGDFFDTRHALVQITIDRAQMICKLLADAGIDIDIIVGNHDTFFKNKISPNSPELLIAHMSNVNIIDKAEQNISCGWLSSCFDMVPWINESNEEEITKWMSTSKSPICMGHFDIAGFMMNKSVKSQYKSNMKSSFLSMYEVVFSGHFHTHSKDGNIIYIGTPYELTWADWNDPKGFYVIDFELEKKGYTYERVILDTTYFCQVDFYPDATNKYMVDTVSVPDFNEVLELCRNKIVRMNVKQVVNASTLREVSLKIEESAFSYECFDYVTEQAELKDSDDTFDVIDIANEYVDESDTFDIEQKRRFKLILNELYLNALAEK